MGEMVGEGGKLVENVEQWWARNLFQQVGWRAISVWTGFEGFGERWGLLGVVGVIHSCSLSLNTSVH